MRFSILVTVVVVGTFALVLNGAYAGQPLEADASKRQKLLSEDADDADASAEYSRRYRCARNGFACWNDYSCCSRVCFFERRGRAGICAARFYG